MLEDSMTYEQEQDILHLEISDQDLLKCYFAERVVHSLLEKERMLVVVPDRMDENVPTKILAKYNLAHYSIAYTSSDDLRPQIAERMEMLSKLKEIPLLRQEYSHSLLKYKEVHHKLKDSLHSITKGTVKSPSFKEMLLSTNPRPEARIPESVLETISEININKTIIKQIRKFQSRFDRRFTFMDASSGLSEACLEDNEALKFAKAEISELAAAITELTVEIEHELYTKKRVIADELEEEIAAWLRLKDELQHAFLEYELDNYPTSFEDKGMAVISKFSGFKYLKLSSNVTPEFGWGQVPRILDKVTAIIANARQSVDRYFGDYLRKLSPYNTANEQLDAWIKKGTELLTRINNSKYLTFKGASKFLQLDALLDELRRVRQQLEYARNAIFDKAYINFIKNRKELSLTGTLMNNLAYCADADWARIIEFYGHQSHLNKNYNANMSRLSEWFQELEQAHQLLRHTSNKEAHNRWCHQRSQSLTAMRNSNWELYQRIFESDESVESSLNEIIDQLGDLLQDFFPIMIVKESDLKKLMDDHPLKFETSIFLDPKKVQVDEVSALLEKKIKLTIASTHSLRIADLGDDMNVLSFYSSESVMGKANALTALDKTSRYKYALSLAATLNSIARPLHIYKIGDQVIINCTDQLLNKRLCAELNISTNHILFTATTDIGDLVEILIHYDNLHLITENGLLNDEKPLSALWQKRIMRHLMDSGIMIHNVYTYELYQDLEGALRKSLKGITLSQEELKEEDVVMTV